MAIHEELAGERKLPLPFVERLLRNANGVHNKYNNIYLPIMDEYKEVAELRRLWSQKICKVNEERNAVAHRGEFRSKVKATEMMRHTPQALREILQLHDGGANIKAFEA